MGTNIKSIKSSFLDCNKCKCHSGGTGGADGQLLNSGLVLGGEIFRLLSNVEEETESYHDCGCVCGSGDYREVSCDNGRHLSNATITPCSTKRKGLPRVDTKRASNGNTIVVARIWENLSASWRIVAMVGKKHALVPYQKKREEIFWWEILMILYCK